MSLVVGLMRLQWRLEQRSRMNSPTMITSSISAPISNYTSAPPTCPIRIPQSIWTKSSMTAFNCFLFIDKYLFINFKGHLNCMVICATGIIYLYLKFLYMFGFIVKQGLSRAHRAHINIIVLVFVCP